MKTIEDILKSLKASEGVDFEGDRTFRVHIKTAEQLIKDAYKLGINHKEDGRQCPICGEGVLTEHIEYTSLLNLSGVLIGVPLLYSTCDNCLSEQGSRSQMNFNKRAMAATKRLSMFDEETNSN